MDRHSAVMESIRPRAEGPYNPQMFGNAGLEHMDKYGKLIIEDLVHGKPHNTEATEYVKKFQYNMVLQIKKIYSFRYKANSFCQNCLEKS